MLKTALVVDDDHLERAYLSELLTRNGFVVRAEASVPNALAAVRAMRFDCLFIDDRMPSGLGAQTLQAIRRAGTTREGDEPTAFLLGDSRDESTRHYREDGFAFFLEKPAEADSLVTALTGEDAETDRQSDGARAEKATAAVTGTDKKGEGGKVTLSTLEAAGIDTAMGIKNCGTPENYLSALEIFMNGIDKKSAEVEGYFERGEWKDYTVKVHALKSSARIIGATALSANAQRLEDAGNRGDLEMIRRETPALLRDWRAFHGRLEAAVRDQEPEERPGIEANETILTDALGSIGEFAEQMDYDLVEMVLDSMKEYRLPQEEEERFRRIRQALLALDWEAIRKEVT